MLRVRPSVGRGSPRSPPGRPVPFLARIFEARVYSGLWLDIDRGRRITGPKSGVVAPDSRAVDTRRGVRHVCAGLDGHGDGDDVGESVSLLSLS
jgi:hypothetical protein